MHGARPSIKYTISSILFLLQSYFCCVYRSKNEIIIFEGYDTKISIASIMKFLFVMRKEKKKRKKRNEKKKKQETV